MKFFLFSDDHELKYRKQCGICLASISFLVLGFWLLLSPLKGSKRIFSSKVKYPCSPLEYSGHSGKPWFASFGRCIFFSEGLEWSLAKESSMHTSEVLSWGQRANGLQGPSLLIKWGWGISPQRAWPPEMAQSAGESSKAKRKLSLNCLTEVPHFQRRKLRARKGALAAQISRAGPWPFQVFPSCCLPG